MEFGLNIAGLDSTITQTARALDVEAVRDVLVEGQSVVDGKTGIANIDLPEISVPVKGVKLNDASVVDANGIAQLSTVDNVTTAGSQNALSANQGKILNDRIDNLSNLGRYLAIWDCTTGKPTTDPASTPYAYKAGDYYRVGTTGTTNYKPNGNSYDGTASSTSETAAVATGDVYFYDGTVWSLQINHLGAFVEDVTVNGTSVVSGGTAAVSAVTDVRVNGSSVVSGGIANITQSGGGGNLHVHYLTLRTTGSYASTGWMNVFFTWITNRSTAFSSISELIADIKQIRGTNNGIAGVSGSYCYSSGSYYGVVGMVVPTRDSDTLYMLTLSTFNQTAAETMCPGTTYIYSDTFI